MSSPEHAKILLENPLTPDLSPLARAEAKRNFDTTPTTSTSVVSNAQNPPSDLSRAVPPSDLSRAVIAPISPVAPTQLNMEKCNEAEQQQIIIMLSAEGCSTDFIAAKTGIPQNIITSILSLGSIKQQITEHIKDPSILDKQIRAISTYKMHALFMTTMQRLTNEPNKSDTDLFEKLADRCGFPTTTQVEIRTDSHKSITFNARETRDNHEVVHTTGANIIHEADFVELNGSEARKGNKVVEQEAKNEIEKALVSSIEAVQ